MRVIYTDTTQTHDPGSCLGAAIINTDFTTGFIEQILPHCI